MSPNLSKTPNYQSGKSIIELLIVLVIVAIIVTFAVLRFGKSDANLARQNIAREFKVSLERARFDSVRRRASSCADMSRVTINDSTSFSVTTDLNQNGILESSESRLVSFANRNDTTMVGNEITFPVTIRFNERGQAILTDCVSTPEPNIPLLYFCNGSCSPLTANAENSNVLFISSTGTIAMMPGDSTMPTFDIPEVTNVNSNVQINKRLSVWDPTTPTPLPTATPTPVSTPNATPTPRPCNPQPNWEHPSQTGCQCVLPMTVRSNGQCK